MSASKTKWKQKELHYWQCDASKIIAPLCPPRDSEAITRKQSTRKFMEIRESMKTSVMPWSKMKHFRRTLQVEFSYRGKQLYKCLKYLPSFPSTSWTACVCSLQPLFGQRAHGCLRIRHLRQHKYWQPPKCEDPSHQPSTTPNGKLSFELNGSQHRLCIDVWLIQSVSRNCSIKMLSVRFSGLISELVNEMQQVLERSIRYQKTFWLFRWSLDSIRLRLPNTQENKLRSREQ